MPNLPSSEKCCGCSACYNVCPKSAISMKANYTGFLYPVIDNSLCVKCNKCERSCPVVSPLEVEQGTRGEKAYIIQHKDEEIRRQSTSGGAFTAIAEQILDLGGVVFGASMDESFCVHHRYVTDRVGLALFRNSKYVQSEIGDSYSECKAFLGQGKWVCFSGTPCQIHGLKKFLNREYERLLTVDIVCHSVPSPLIFRKYVELQKENCKHFNQLVFRDKAWGYSYSTMALYNNEKCVYRSGSETDLWFRSFLPGLCDRENCYSCMYQEWPRKSDVTIWDCFTVGEIDKTFDDNKGTTSMIVWSKTGHFIVGKVIESGACRIKEVDSLVFKKKILREVEEKVKVDRTTMYKDAVSMSSVEFFNKYRPTTWKVKCKRIAKRMLYISGLYNVVKRITKQ